MNKYTNLPHVATMLTVSTMTSTAMVAGYLTALSQHYWKSL